MKFRNGLSVIIVVLIVSILVAFSGEIFRPIETDSGIAATKAFHELPENSVDVLLFGSSHTWRGVNPAEMYEKYGIGAYTYATNWQTISTEALYVMDALRTQTPKVVLIDTFRVDAWKEDCDLDGEIYYTRGISDFPYKEKYLNTAFGNNWKRYLSYYWPFYAFHSSWSTFEVENFKNCYSSKEYLKTLGYSLDVNEDAVFPVDIINYSNFVQYPLEEKTADILEEVVGACHEKGVEVVFYTVPWEGQNNYHDAMQQFAVTHDCKYLDLFVYLDDAKINTKKDFCDEGHMNSDGAVKTADFIGDYLLSHYDLPDRRNEKNSIFEDKLGNVVGKKYKKWHKEIEQ